jgi:alpha-L-fucosidase
MQLYFDNFYQLNISPGAFIWRHIMYKREQQNGYSLFLKLIFVMVYLASFLTELNAQTGNSDKKLPTQIHFEPEWKSLEQYKCPEWFRDAKLGIYVTWGIYSVPAYGCWYGRKMYENNQPQYAYHVEHYGHPSEFGYIDFIPLWRAENFNPDNWLTMFKDVGARYFTPIATFHDGFDLWDSPHPFNAVKMGPKKNLLKMMQEATYRHGLRWGFTTHLARNYNFFQPGYGSDNNGPKKGIPYIADSPANIKFYHPNHGDTNPKYPKNPSESWKKSWSSRLIDLIDRYKPDLLYFDGAVPFNIDDGLTGRHILAHYYNSGIERYNHDGEVVMNIKTARNGHGIFHEGIATLDLERSTLDKLRKEPWQTDDTIGERYWSYTKNMKYRSVDYLIDKFIDIVSKNGNLLLSLPPKADGTFEPAVHEILAKLGEWNRQNGEAIFATRPWTKYGEGEIRFTRSKDGKILYIILLTWPEKGQVTVKSLSEINNVIEGKISNICLLGSDKEITWKSGQDGLQLTLPEQTNEYAVAVKIEINGKLILTE